MIDRSLFTQGHGNPASPVPLSHDITVPTERMASLLCSLLGTTGSVLEIGTGSGYQTAILAETCEQVTSIEINPFAVADLLPGNVTLIIGDGRKFDTNCEYDGILVTFAAEEIEPVWIRQLKDGGRLVVPRKVGSNSLISIYRKAGNVLELIDVPAYARFVAAA